MEKALEEFLEEMLNTNPSIKCHMSFHRDLTEEESEKMNNALSRQGMKVVSVKRSDAFEVTEGENSYHLERVSVFP